MCIVKDKETVHSVVVSLMDIPGTAERNIGMCMCYNCVLTIYNIGVRLVC